MFASDNKTEFRLMVDGILSARDNMSIDRELFEDFSDNSLPVLRLYAWQDSCTIGISQQFEDINDILEYEDRYAQRITGGGILFHGHDISYSLVIPTSCVKGLSVKQSYESICMFLLKFYKNLGLDSQYAKDSIGIQLSNSQYCQLGFEPYDIVVDGKKIGGNAQRRAKKVIFQHGSIPIYSTRKDEIFGHSLEDFGIELSLEEAQHRLICAFEETFRVELIRDKDER